MTKIAGGLLMPIPVVLVLLLTGLVLLRSSRFRKASIGLLAAGTVILFLVSTPPFSAHGLASLEGRYPVLLEPPEAEWIAVLGGGSRSNDRWPPATRLSRSSLYRLAEGVRLARRLPDAMLITSGGASPAGMETARVMAQVAREWGIEPGRIVMQAEPKNTAAEAEAVARRIAAGDRVILVTSAVHMARAVALFQGQGVAVVPAPAGHFATPERRYRHVGDVLPGSTNIDFAERLLWERVGLAWARLRGQAD